MEYVVIWLFSLVALGNEIEIVNDKNTSLQIELALQEVQVNNLETTILKTAGAHANLYARYNQDVENLTERLERLEGN